MQTQQAQPNVLASITNSAGAGFVIIAVCVPIAALVYALNFGTITALNYVHVLTGGLWTGVDLFMGFVLGSVLGGLEPRERAAFFKRFIPRMTFLMPVLAGVTATAGFSLTTLRGLPMDDPRIVAAIIVTGILAAQGFGLLLPNEIRIFRQLLSPQPDIDKIASLGMLNAKLGGVQGVFQLVVIAIMAMIRF